MHSHLTRYVFRQILRNKPFSHAQLAGHLPLRRSCLSSNSPPGSKAGTRSLWGFSRKPARELKSRDIDPGVEDMMNLSYLLKMNVRPPRASAVVSAFNTFFASKYQGTKPLVQYQAAHAMVAFKHLQETNTEEEGFGLADEDLHKALWSLTYIEGKDVTIHQEFSPLLFQELKLRNEAKPEQDSQTFSQQVVLPYLRILSQLGESLKARQLLEQYPPTSTVLKDRRLFWMPILKGFAQEDNEQEILRTIEIMEKNGMPFDAQAQRNILQVYIKKDDLASIKRWYEHSGARGNFQTAGINRSVLGLCIRHKDFEWGQKILPVLLEQKTDDNKTDKLTWDITFQWSAAQGKGVDDIERMMEVMVRKSKEDGEEIRPDGDTINGLLEIANSLNDPYTAERFIALADRWKVRPNARRFLLQMDYRLKTKDISGAREAYKQLRAYDIPDDADVPLVNRLILALCSSPDPDHATIMTYVEDLTERKAAFDATTVAALCLLHLQNDELYEVINLLRSHVFHYNLPLRTTIADVFVSFILDRNNRNKRAWDAYSILQSTFGETSNDIRIRLMTEFFDRRRPDMGLHVFGKMRQNQIKSLRPNAEHYVACFQGLAMHKADLSTLELAHNMLKLDSEVEPNTRLYNALMIAYTACGEPHRSLELWDDIVYSREGPNYSSIVIALHACEKKPFGTKAAHKIWERLRKFEVEVTKEIYEAYVSALAGNGLGVEAFDLVDGMEAMVGVRPDRVTIGALYNACRGDVKKAEAETWAKEKYPGLWTELEEKVGRRREKRESLFRIDVTVAP